MSIYKDVYIVTLISFVGKKSIDKHVYIRALISKHDFFTKCLHKGIDFKT